MQSHTSVLRGQGSLGSKTPNPSVSSCPSRHRVAANVIQLNGHSDLFQGQTSSSVELLRKELSDLRHQVITMKQENRWPHIAASPGTSTSSLEGIQPRRKLNRDDWEMLPKRIILLRHAESQGNVERNTYCTQPDHTVPLTANGRKHARAMGRHLHSMIRDLDGTTDFRVFFMTSPYNRTLQTTDLLLEAFDDDQVLGVRQAVQLREQDFGNFQDPARIEQDLTDRQRFGRFYYRFPNGESGADVYDRLTIFEDHLTRDMLMGRFADMSLSLVTHGLTLRIFLMRWFHWSVDEFLEVYNPDNCKPIVIEKLSWDELQELQGRKFANAKHSYALTPESLEVLKGCTPEMASYKSRVRYMISPRTKWWTQRQRMAERGLYGAFTTSSSVSASPKIPALLDMVPGSASYQAIDSRGAAYNGVTYNSNEYIGTSPGSVWDETLSKEGEAGMQKQIQQVVEQLQQEQQEQEQLKQQLQ